MWLEAILTREDLALVLQQMTPLRLRLGADEHGPERLLYLGRPSHVELVSGHGLRIICKAKVRWEVLGLKVPVDVSSVQVLVTPHIVRKDGHDTLSFRVVIEDVDLSALPGFLDQAVASLVNRALKGAETDMAWDFVKTLTFKFALPDSIRPLEQFGLLASWGEVKVTDEAMVLVVAFKTRVPRGDTVPPPAEDDGIETLIAEDEQSVASRSVPRAEAAPDTGGKETGAA